MSYRQLLNAGAVGLFAMGALFAQQSKVVGKVPRAADGHPDLTGLWTNATRTPLERSAEFAGKPTLTPAEAKEWEAKEKQAWKELDGTSEGPLHKTKGSEGTGAYNVLFYDMGSGLATIDGLKRTSMVVDPPDGHVPPLTPEARQRMGRRVDANTANLNDVKARPITERCLVGDSSFVPMLPVLYNNNYQIVQTADSVMIMTEMIHDVRIIHIGTRRPASANGSAIRSATGKGTRSWSKPPTSTTRPVSAAPRRT